MKKTGTAAAKALCLLLALFMVFSLAACSGTDAGGDDEEKILHTGKNVKSPSGVKYFTKNNLTVDMININSDGSVRTIDYPAGYEYSQMSDDEKEKWDAEEVFFSGHYMQVSGLKDKDVEEIVNEKLKNLCLDNINKIPPYRGIKAEIGENPESAKEGYKSAYQSVELNDNNILSVTMYVSGSYKSVLVEKNEYGYDNSVYFAFQETLNLDLNTGNDIGIADMFCNDVDALACVNEAINEAIARGNGDEEIWDIGSDVKIAAPFTGISADQKYSINNSGINIVLDYETPEFDTGYYPAFVTVPFSDKVAVSERFFDEKESIYESEVPVSKHFPYSIQDAQNIEIVADEYKTIGENGTIYLIRNANCPKSVPKYIKERMSDFVNIPEEEILSEINEKLPEDANLARIVGDYSLTARVYEVGPFVNITYSGYKYVYEGRQDDSEEQRDYFYEEISRRETYDTRLKQNEPIELSDIFKEDADISGIIKQAFIDSINKSLDSENSTRLENSNKLPAFKTGSSNEIEKLNEEYIDKLYDNIIYFSIDCESIYFTFETLPAEIYREIYGTDPFEDGNAIYINAVGWITYDTLDCDKLTIFDL